MRKLLISELKSFLILAAQGPGTGLPTLCGVPHKELGIGMVAGFPPLLLETHSGQPGVVAHSNPSTGEAEAGGSL